MCTAILGGATWKITRLLSLDNTKGYSLFFSPSILGDYAEWCTDHANPCCVAVIALVAHAIRIVGWLKHVKLFFWFLGHAVQLQSVAVVALEAHHALRLVG